MKKIYLLAFVLLSSHLITVSMDDTEMEMSEAELGYQANSPLNQGDSANYAESEYYPENYSVNEYNPYE